MADKNSYTYTNNSPTVNANMAGLTPSMTITPGVVVGQGTWTVSVGGPQTGTAPITVTTVGAYTVTATNNLLTGGNQAVKTFSPAGTNCTVEFGSTTSNITVMITGAPGGL